MGMWELQGGQEGSPSHLRGPHMAPLPRAAQEKAEHRPGLPGTPAHCRFQVAPLGRRGAATGKAGAQRLGAHWPARKPTPEPRILQEGASWGCSGAGSSQRPSRACRTGASREAAEWTETPGAPMLVSQQSNPQSVRACFMASTSGCSRSGGRESSRSPHNRPLP